MMEGEKEKLIKMEERLKERVVGQSEAIEAVSNAVRRARAGLQDPNRPIGTFLFLDRLVWARLNSARHWPLFSLMTIVRWSGLTCLNSWSSTLSQGL